jgi:H+/Cl- antiporter ClcA
MRFKRSDIPGFVIAVVAPPLLTLLIFNSYDIWHHRGTPLLGTVAANFGILAGLLAIFSRFVRNWDVPMVIGFVLGTIVFVILWMQRMGFDHTATATTLKWLALLTFFAFNASIGWQVLDNGLRPLLDRRDARRAAGK